MNGAPSLPSAGSLTAGFPVGKSSGFLGNYVPFNSDKQAQNMKATHEKSLQNNPLSPMENAGDETSND